MGGILSGVGSMMGGKKASDAAKQQAQAQLQAAQLAAKTARLGFDYLTTGQGSKYMTPYLEGGSAANNEIRGLLGIGGNPTAANDAFNKFLGSTNYRFLLNQGLQAAQGNAAAHGTLDSGATLKALNDYGQGMAGNALGGYFTQLGNLGTQGLDALKTIGAAGSQAGQAGATALMNGQTNASNLIMQGVGAQNQGFTSLLGGIDGLFNSPQTFQNNVNSWGNFFGNIF